jgi:hypothetical protein
MHNLEKENRERIKAIQSLYPGYSYQDTVAMLIDLYELKDIDLLIQQVKNLYNSTNIQAKQINQLSVLYTQLGMIVKQTLF